jgi:hypothetical protein
LKSRLQSRLFVSLTERGIKPNASCRSWAKRVSDSDKPGVRARRQSAPQGQ